MSETVRAFSALLEGPDEAIPLDRGALLIARVSQPDLDIEHYLNRLDLMADHISLRLSSEPTPLQYVIELNRYLYDDEGFQGNTDSFYDPRNSFLNEVMERKVGIPISLSVIYMELARRLHFPLKGVGLPGHFLVKHPLSHGEILIDPFNRGAILTEDDCRERLAGLYGANMTFDERYLLAVPRKRILTRMINNLKAIYIHAQEPYAAIQMMDLLLALDPTNADELQARGYAWMQLECFRQACADLEQFLALRPDAPESDQVRNSLLMARAMEQRIN